jgi:hypothetical protein
LYMIWARITLEFMIIVFRIGEDVRRIADAPRQPGYPPAPPTGFPPANPGSFLPPTPPAQ